MIQKQNRSCYFIFVEISRCQNVAVSATLILYKNHYLFPCSDRNCIIFGWSNIIKMSYYFIIFAENNMSEEQGTFSSPRILFDFARIIFCAREIRLLFRAYSPVITIWNNICLLVENELLALVLSEVNCLYPLFATVNPVLRLCERVCLCWAW